MHHMLRLPLAQTITGSCRKKEASLEAVHLPLHRRNPPTAGILSPENVPGLSKNKELDSTSCEGASVCSFVGVITATPNYLQQVLLEITLFLSFRERETLLYFDDFGSDGGLICMWIDLDVFRDLPKISRRLMMLICRIDVGQLEKATNKGKFCDVRDNTKITTVANLVLFV
ncbi:hypothetical protein L1987_42485 [Smallanthus sonchifolius]|uniref:Uncharacterized protein n=1 Tax=Smallanthus sonchifolius TaxID=185202 RepID=A0ACB9GIR8_9ASTR|nr:hypothetical protein L1987_42485 [Smallanthus sonchifolius]